MTTNKTGLEHGLAFVERLFELVHEFGPPDFTQAEKEALGNYLAESAVGWVQATNRNKLQGPTQ